MSDGGAVGSGDGAAARAAALDRLRGGLIVSVQAEADSVLDTPETIALLALCAVRNGAAGVRIEGAARIAAVRAAVGVPIVGIVKRRHPGFEPYITSTFEELAAVAAAGAELAAFDATPRARAGGASVADLAREAHRLGLAAMADCAEPADVGRAIAAGCDVVGSTLAGYTRATEGTALPALDLVRFAALRHPFAVCEGGVGTPGDVAAAFAAGASAVVVGTAITNVDVLVRRFAAAAPATRAT